MWAVPPRSKTVPVERHVEPPVLTGALIGYARVSTRDQHLHRQTDALTEAGCRRVFADKQSGKDMARPELVAALAFMRLGDTLVVTSLDRLSRSLSDLIAMVTERRRRQVGFRSLHEQLDTTPGGRLVFHVFAALAEFLRELIVEGTREGLEAARARGRVGGRPVVMTPEKIAAARSLLPSTASRPSPGWSASAAARSTPTGMPSPGIVALLRDVRKQYATAVVQGQICIGREHHGRQWYCSNDPSVERRLDCLRRRAVHEFSAPCVEAGLPSLSIFPMTPRPSMRTTPGAPAKGALAPAGHRCRTIGPRRRVTGGTPRH
jgi:DNA invertase Pin-like site-specific DNA recombinase